MPLEEKREDIFITYKNFQRNIEGKHGQTIQNGYYANKRLQVKSKIPNEPINNKNNFFQCKHSEQIECIKKWRGKGKLDTISKVDLRGDKRLDH